MVHTQEKMYQKKKYYGTQEEEVILVIRKILARWLDVNANRYDQ
jgi:hypothetical protein